MQDKLFILHRRNWLLQAKIMNKNIYADWISQAEAIL